MLSGKMVDGVLTLMIVHASGEAWHELTDGPNAKTYLKNTPGRARARTRATTSSWTWHSVRRPHPPLVVHPCRLYRPRVLGLKF